MLFCKHFEENVIMSSSVAFFPSCFSITKKYKIKIFLSLQEAPVTYVTFSQASDDIRRSAPQK